jgi:hypothetical protein
MEADMKLQLGLMFVIAPLALASCTQERPSDRPAVSPAAKIVGEAESCVQITQLRESRIRDDWTIDFIRSGNRAWRNTLPYRCNGLKSEDAFTYETSLTQLCSTDIIYVLQRVGGSLQRGPGCGLGKFVPVELEK